MTKIYTKSGDKGKTSLVGGRRVSKTDIQIEAYGTVDELNSFVGLLVSSTDDSVETDFLVRIQHHLFDLGTLLASEMTADSTSISLFADSHIHQLEAHIDEIDQQLPPLHNFILPGGIRPAALSHVCRTICRRAERHIVRLYEQKNIVSDESIIRYINRLSDYFFLLSRKLNKNNEFCEIYWHKNCK